MCVVSGWVYSCNCRHLIEEAPQVCHEVEEFGTYCTPFKIEPVYVNYRCRDCQEKHAAIDKEYDLWCEKESRADPWDDRVDV